MDLYQGHFFTKILLALGFLYSPLAHGLPDDVKILAWFSYIDRANPEVIRIEKTCNAKISVDEYYSNGEFLSVIQHDGKKGQNYDIIIYTDTVSHAILPKVNAVKSTNLQTMIKSYDSNIRSKYILEKYPQNTVIFQLSLTGFLFNKNNINITAADPLTKVFKSSEGKIVVLLDDHVEIQTLLNKLDCVGLDAACKKDKKDFFPSEESLRLLVGKSAVTFTNDVARLVGHPNFSFAYLWSGESLLKMKDNKNLSFLVHPQLSHVSKDLLSAMNNKWSTECVAREFGSAAFLESIARESFYFSPYGKISSKNAEYNIIQNEFFSKLPELDWIHKVSIEESKQIAEKWQALKIKLQTPF